MSETFKKVRYGLVALLLLACTAVQAQSISGNVKDANGEPVIGATIMEQGTQNGTVTDFDGNFTLKLQKGGNINVSYVGMKPQVIKTAGKSSVNVTLEDDNTTLNDIVVVGYGTMKKSDLTGSVSSVNTEQLNAKGAPSVMENLQGATPGVNITTTGRVGESASIEIRGRSSISDDVSPLYVVDGIFCDDIDWLNPQDIEKIDILKDASSTAIYGSRATAGVVMVTTKSGATVQKDQKPTISYDGYIGWTKTARMPKFYNAEGWAHYRFMKFQDGIYNLSNNPVYRMTASDYDLAMMKDDDGVYRVTELLNEGRNTDWVDAVTQTGLQQNHYLAINGSAKGLAYNFGLGYNNEKGVYKGDEQQKVNFKGAIDAEINKYLKAGFTFNASYSDLSQTVGDAIKEAFLMVPLFRIYDADGNYIVYPGQDTESFGYKNGAAQSVTSTVNSLMRMQNNQNQQNTWRLLGNAYLQFEPIKGLTFKTTYSPNYKNTRKGDYTGFINPATGSYYDPDNKYNSWAYLINRTDFSWTWDNVVNYNKRFGEDKHSIGVMGLYSVHKETTEYQRSGASGLNEDLLWWNLNMYDSDSGGYKEYKDDTTYGLRNYWSSHSMTSWAMRLNYGYLDRYLITATMRWDGSSKFQKDNRWGSFPSVALAWRMTEEPWMKKVDWLSNLKLRLSYGVTGNCESVGPYQTLSNFSNGAKYVFGNTTAVGYKPADILDKNLKWEKSSEINFGIDFGFLNNRITGSVDIYSKTLKDQLYDAPLTLVSGSENASIFTNIGKVRNKGVEISLTTVNIKTKDWMWTTTFNFSHNKNEVKDINGLDSKVGETEREGCLEIGKSINNINVLDYLGVVTDRMMTIPVASTEALQKEYDNAGFTAGQQVHEYEFYGKIYGQGEGGAKFDDVNQDGVYDAKDRKVISTDPKWTGSFSTSLSWKNWDFGMSLYARVGGKIYSPFMNEYGGGMRAKQRIEMDYYIPAGSLLSCDGVNSDGTYINPVYQESTVYGEYPTILVQSNKGINYYINNSGIQEIMEEGISVVSGTYVKCKNITLGYTFPKKWLTPWGCSHLRLYFTVTNPFVITKYKGFDPEWASVSLKNDVPSTVTYQIGASIKF